MPAEPPSETRPGLARLTETRPPAVPSMLDLVRLSPRRLFPPGGEALYRQIAVLTEMGPGTEVLDVAAGKGVSLQYFVEEFGVTASGVEFDPALVESAESWSRDTRAGHRIQFQEGRSDALPYRDEIFDVSIGELALANHCDPGAAIHELVRVTKPGGFVVLVQLVWKAPVDEDRRAVLSEHLGARPMMVVEWRRLLREAGVEDIHVEDWSDEETAFRPTVAKPFPDFTELFSVGERMMILRRAWRRWGWRGVRAAVARENAVHKLLTGERILGLDLLRGRKAGEAAGPAEDARVPESEGDAGEVVAGDAARERSAGEGAAGRGSVGEEAAGGGTALEGAAGEGAMGDRVVDERAPSEVDPGSEAAPEPPAGEADAERVEPPASSETAGLPLFGGQKDTDLDRG